MIRSIRPQGLKRLYEQDDASALFAEHVPKVRDILARLDSAASAADMNLPGFKLHALKGDRRALWAVTVRANWRVVFRFSDGDVMDVDYVDYH